MTDTLTTPVWNGTCHPAAELFPMLDAVELAELAKDIKERGVDIPGILLPDGTLLDGRNRRLACEQAGVEMRWEIYTGDAPVAKVVSRNLRHRQLDVGQRAMLGVKLLPMLEKEAALRLKLATGRPSKPGADLPQVKERGPRARDEAAAIVGSSGRAIAQAKRVIEKAPELAERVEAGTLALDAAEKEVKATIARESYYARKATWDSEANSKGKQWEIMHGDFRDMLASLDDGSVDAIVTDPPYPDEFMPLWGDLAKHALRVLRPGAPLIAYSGQRRLREVLNHLCGPLTYGWTVCLQLPGVNSRVMGPNMFQTWKPVIICTAGKWQEHDWHKDTVVSPTKDQELYEWQQNPDPAAELIRRYVPKGGLVLDPFTGVGSFGVAALTTGRRFLGVELDDERHLEACERLAKLDVQVAA